MEKIGNYIDGKLEAPISGQYFDNINPSTGAVYSLIPDSGEEDVQRAVTSATAALKNGQYYLRKKDRIICLT